MLHLGHLLCMLDVLNEKTMKTAFFTLHVLMLLLSACGTKNESIEISSAVMNQLAPGQSTGAVYLNIKNTLNKTLTLNYVHSDNVEKIEVHRHIYDNGMMQMRQVKHLIVDAKSELIFKPGGYHLMLFGINSPLVKGDQFSIWFEFSGESPIEVNVGVKAL